MFLPHFVEGSAVVLRPITPEDAAQCVLWLREPETTRYLSRQYDDLTVDEELEWIRNMSDSAQDLVAAICVRESDGSLRHIGNTGFHNIDRANGRAEIGIFIGDSSCRGRGIGTDAIRTMTTYAFQEMGLRRVYARVLAPNRASRMTCERVGFVHEGVLRANYVHPAEGPLDEYCYGMLASEWSV